MKFVAGALAGLVAGLAVAALITFTGTVNVAATSPDSSVTEWLLHTAMRRSVAARSGSVTAPKDYTEAQAKSGFQEYGAMCAGCHGAPGRMRSAAGKGMRPGAPDLAQAGQSWDNASLFWIVRNGVNMTGMPAFGPTHDDDTIWNIVAFVRKLPGMSAEEYRAYESSAGGEMGQMHEH